MISIETKGAEGLKTMTSLLNSLNDECNFNLTADGLVFKCMDIDRTALLDCDWNKDKFNSWNVVEDTKLGLDLQEFSKIMKRVKDENIKLESEGEKLKILIGDKKSYDVPLKHLEIETPKTPKVEYKVNTEVDLSELKEKLEDLKVIKPFARISIENGNLAFSASEYGHGGKSILPIDSNITENVEGEFSVDHLLNTINAVSGSVKKCKLSMSSKTPMRLVFDIVDVGTVTYYLAPYA